MSAAHSDRNLLFGVLALQMDFLGRDALIAAMHTWVLDKTKPLGAILVEQQTLRPDERDLLDTLVQKHLGQHSPNGSASAMDFGRDQGVVRQPAFFRHTSGQRV